MQWVVTSFRDLVLGGGFPSHLRGNEAFGDHGGLRGFGDRARIAKEWREGRGFGDTLYLAVVADAEEHRGLAFVIEAVDGATLNRLAQLRLAVAADPAGENKLTITQVGEGRAPEAGLFGVASATGESGRRVTLAGDRPTSP